MPVLARVDASMFFHGGRLKYLQQRGDHDHWVLKLISCWLVAWYHMNLFVQKDHLLLTHQMESNDSENKQAASLGICGRKPENMYLYQHVSIVLLNFFGIYSTWLYWAVGVPILRTNAGIPS